MKKISDLEQKVLENYQKVSPSKVDYNSKFDLDTLLKNREDIFLNKLKLPPSIFKNKKVLDFGCGTGEYSIFYAVNGAKLTLLDFNEISLKHLREIFRKQKLTKSIEKILNISGLQWNPKSNEFDIVCSCGVLHHLDKPYIVLEKWIRSLKKNGILYFSIGTKESSIQRELMRKIIRKFCNNLEDSIDLSLELFPTYIKRASKYGGRKVDQIVSDNFLTKLNYRFSLKEIFDFLRKKKIVIYNIYPNLRTNFDEPISVVKERKKSWEEEIDSDFYGYLNYSNEQILKKYNSIESYKIKERKKFALEINEIQTLLKQGDINLLKKFIKKCKVFGLGFCGVGDVHFLGYKK